MASIEHEPRDAEEFREILADDEGTEKLARSRFLELKQAAKLPVFRLGVLELVNAFTQTGIVV